MATDVENIGQDGIYQVVRSLTDRYLGYRRRWVKSQDPEKIKHPERESAIRTMKSRIDESNVWLHVEGYYCVCVFAGPKATKFISFDIDMGDPEVVHKVVDTIEELGIPRHKIYVSMSGRKGYHVDIYIKDKTYNNLAKMFYEEVLERSGLDKHKVEFRPTATQAIKLPLGIHPITHQRCWYVDRETLEPIERFDYIYETEFVAEEEFARIAGEISNRRLSTVYKEMREEYGRICEETKVNVPSDMVVRSQGTRHKLQFRVAVMARRQGASRSGVYSAQMDWYEQQNKCNISSTYEEVCMEANQIADWVCANVKVSAQGTPKRERKEQKVKISASDMAMVLSGETKANRMVAFLMLVACKRYVPAKMAYKTIADMSGFSMCIANRAINALVDNGSLVREKSRRIVGGMVVDDSNQYRLGKMPGVPAPKTKDRLHRGFEVGETLGADNLYNVYINALAYMFGDEYLAKFLKKPELADVRKARNGGATVNRNAGKIGECG